MRPQVVLEGLLVAEALGALGAGVGPLASVRPLVLQEVMLLGEVLAALGAVVGPLARVDALVLQEMVLADETLPADGAGVRTLPGVDAVMVGELGLLAEGLLALAALVGPLAGVSPLVPQEVGGPGEVLPALGAEEGHLALAGVDPLVHDEADLQAEAPPALAAGEGPLPDVGDLVFAEARLVAEAALALGALVGLPRRRGPRLGLEAVLGAPGDPHAPARVAALVQQELLLVAEAEVAIVALVGPFLEMVALVDHEVDLEHEALPALGADVGSLPRPVPLLGDGRLHLPGVSLAGGGLPHTGGRQAPGLRFGAALRLAAQPGLVAGERRRLGPAREHGARLQGVGVVLLFLLLLRLDHDPVLCGGKPEER